MITEAVIKLLQGLTDRPPRIARLAQGANVLLHSRWFALEVPISFLAPEVEIDEETPIERVAWRTGLPPGEGEYAQATKGVTQGDLVPIVKLIAGCGVAVVHPAIYDLVMKQLPEPEFRVFEGERPHVAILSSGIVVGAVAQIKE